MPEEPTRQALRTMVVTPFLIGIPWYRARLRNLTVSSLPSILATLLVMVLTTREKVSR